MFCRSKIKLMKTIAGAVLVISTLFTYCLVFTEFSKVSHTNLISNAIRWTREAKQNAFNNPEYLSEKPVDQCDDPEGMFNEGHGYFRNRSKRITPLDYKFVVKSQTCIDIQRPIFLVVLCISNFDHVHTRNIIRQTWGSVTKTKVWPIRNVNVSDVIVRFLLGSGGLNATQMDAFRHEDSAYGDIIVSDFKDSYYNLTRKVLIGLKWVHTFCPHASYVLKIDEDTFLQMGNLISYLKTLESNSNRVMIGHVHPKPPVLRTGKWGLKRGVYPYSCFPPYAAGNSYVISTDIIKRLVTWSEYLPYVFIEDAAITGILRTAINATILFDGGFTFHTRPPPKLCDFHSRNTTIKTATRTNDEFKQKLWSTLSMSYSECMRHEVMYRRNYRSQKKRIKLRS